VQALLSGEGRITLIKVENVSQEQISVINLNCYMIKWMFTLIFTYFKFSVSPEKNAFFSESVKNLLL
jgi:hypothetical protein